MDQDRDGVVGGSYASEPGSCMKSSITKIGALVVLLASPRMSAASWSDISPRLAARIGVRPLAAINSAPVISNEASSYKGSESPFLGAGIGGFSDVYFDDKVGFELSYNTLFQNQMGGSSAPGEVKRQNMTYLAYLLKYKPRGDTEYGIGGEQFNYESPTAIYQTLNCGLGCTWRSKSFGHAPVSATGFIMQAGFPIKYGEKFNSASTVQAFYIPGNFKRLFGITFGVSFGYNLFTGDRVPVVENKSGLPRGKKLPWQ